MCISDVKYILKSDLDEIGCSIVSELELPRQIIVIETENSKDGIVCTCLCQCQDGRCTRKIQKEIIDLVYQKQ